MAPLGDAARGVTDVGCADQMSFRYNCANVGFGKAFNKRSFVERTCMLAY
jgi:hypothetical protein